MTTLYIYTGNVILRNMLISLVNNRRCTDSGFDIPMLEQEVNYTTIIHTFDLNIKVGATDNNRPIPCLLLPRSSLSGTPFRMANSIGLIDMGYRGYVKAKVDVLQRPNDDYIIPHGFRLFQICRGDFMPWDNVVIVQFENELPEAPDNRGAGGFGSTN